MPSRKSETFYKYDASKRTLARRYEKLKLILGISAGTILPIAISLAVLFTGVSRMFREVFLSVVQSYWISVGLFVIAFFLLLRLVELPLSFYSGYVVDHEFGLSKQGKRDWLVDEVKEFAVEATFLVIMAVVLYYLIATTRLWWIVAGLLFAVFSVFLSTIIPYVIMPVFYKVTPLNNSQLKSKLISMSKKIGVKSIDHVLVADESRKSIRANAMFSGIGNARAIVLFDTLLSGFTPREIVTVVAHELGHYVNKDVWKSALVGGVLALPAFLIIDYILRSSPNSLGLTGISDPAGFPAMFTIFIVVSFLLEPLSNWISRTMERQADEFALRVGDDPDAQASAERRLADMSLAVDKPAPWVEFFFYTHPSSARRIRLAEEWKKLRLRSAVRARTKR